MLQLTPLGVAVSYTTRLYQNLLANQLKASGIPFYNVVATFIHILYHSQNLSGLCCFAIYPAYFLVAVIYTTDIFKQIRLTKYFFIFSTNGVILNLKLI